MTKVKIISPIDQPKGDNRLLKELQLCLDSEEYNDFKIVVAFAKIGPLLKMYDSISNWLDRKNTISAIFGLDQKGTSVEALRFALEYFSKTSILHVRGPFSPTFHPKIYLFTGKNRAMGFIGSNNLTTGGFETNFETYIRFNMTIPTDRSMLNQIMRCWDDVMKYAIQIDNDYLEKLIEDKSVIREKEMRVNQISKNKNIGKSAAEEPTIEYTNIEIKPPAPIPANPIKEAIIGKIVPSKDYKDKSSADKRPTKETVRNAKTTESLELPVSGLIIQIVPHHNGEVFLSKTAVDQNPAFFGWPFTGQTVPKKAENPSYPQREPDPVVNIFLYDEEGRRVFKIYNYDLNTVYYELKSEIRITVPQDIVRDSRDFTKDPYPLMVMTHSSELGLDYNLEIYLPGSNQYSEYISICNQDMPSGGKEVARKFGWI